MPSDLKRSEFIVIVSAFFYHHVDHPAAHPQLSWFDADRTCRSGLAGDHSVNGRHAAWRAYAAPRLGRAVRHNHLIDPDWHCHKAGVGVVIRHLKQNKSERKLTSRYSRLAGLSAGALKKPGSLIADCRVIILGPDKRSDVALVRAFAAARFFRILRNTGYSISNIATMIQASEIGCSTGLMKVVASPRLPISDCRIERSAQRPQNDGKHRRRKPDSSAYAEDTRQAPAQSSARHQTSGLWSQTTPTKHRMKMIGVRMVNGIASTRTKIGISAKFSNTVTKFCNIH